MTDSDGQQAGNTSTGNDSINRGKDNENPVYESNKHNGRGGTRTHTPLRAGDFKSPADFSHPIDNKEVTNSHESDFAKSLAIYLQNHPELAQLIEAWPVLPDHIKAAIKALVQTYSQEIE